MIALPDVSTLSSHAQKLFLQCFPPSHPKGLRKPKRVSQYTWQTLCLTFKLKENEDIEEQCQILNEEYCMVWDIEKNVYLVVDLD